MLQQKAKLLYNRKISNQYARLAFFAPQIARQVQPGQFLQVKVAHGYAPLLRRPFSIHRVENSNIEILYEVVGRATELLWRKKRGEYLDIIGPLGNGFNYSAPVLSCSSASVLVAGGMGVAPLVFLAKKLVTTSPRHHVTSRPLVLIGTKTKKQILCEKEFKELGYGVKIATDDGSRGFKGKVTELLKKLLSTIDHRLSTIYACGPKPMLKEISRIAAQYHIPAQISLEAHLACGIGACLGCAVKTKTGYQRVCQEGPVFRAQEIVW